jgi:predicted nucleic acid-binding Zn ribbon protein
MQEANGRLHCTQCGKNISASSLFCDQCGSPVRVIVQPVAQPQAARSSNTARPAEIVILGVGALLVVLVCIVGLLSKGASTDPATSNSKLNLADFCKNFPFDDKCPDHDQYKSRSMAHQPADTSQSVILPQGQAARDEFARMVNDTGEGLIREHAKGETLIVESEAFDDSINRRHFRQLVLGGTGETYKDTDGKLCGLGFSELRLVGPTKVEEKLIPCG